MKVQEAAELADVALSVAQRAGALAQAGYRKPMTVAHKGVIDLVTNFDTETEQFIRQELSALTPHISVVAEEEGGNDQGDRIWYVDPIDGTTNYAHGHPFWCVSIGLVVRGIPVAGAVVAPSLGVTWSGSLGNPALRNGERCRVSDQASLKEAFLATGFPYDRQTSSDDNFNRFFHLKKRVLGIRRCGSAALDLCLVADGTYDGYWERKLRPWDLAAGVAILQAAGGRATSFEGSQVDVTSGIVIASNGHVHERLLRELWKAENSAHQW